MQILVTSKKGEPTFRFLYKSKIALNDFSYLALFTNTYDLNIQWFAIAFRV